MKMYMAVTRDMFEWPIAFSDTKKGLSTILGLSETAVFYCLKRHGTPHNTYMGEKYNVVEVEVEND